MFNLYPISISSMVGSALIEVGTSMVPTSSIRMIVTTLTPFWREPLTRLSVG